MSELREVIERQFRAHGLLSDAENKEHTPEVDATEAQTDEQTVVSAIAAPPEYQGKFASEFKNLPEEWQIFLCEREAENKKKNDENCAKLDAYNVLETLFGEKRDRLHAKGIDTVTQWLQGLAWLDAAMDENPAATLGAIAAVYGVNSDALRSPHNEVHPAIMARVCELERNYHDLTSYLREVQNRNFVETLEAFGRQTDREGNRLHPHFEEVKQEICDLLRSGAAKDMETAYQDALWLNPQIRKELVKKQIDSEATAAEISKKAVFALKGKAEKPARELTLRETIAKNMAKYVD